MHLRSRTSIWTLIFKLALILCVVSAPTFAEQDIRGIAFIPDPPPEIDGSLNRFRTVPNWWAFDQAANVVFGKEKWAGTTDLAGKAVLGWDTQYLYVAADVVDDAVLQPFYGGELWRGDHVILLLDVPRQPAGARDQEKVIQIGLSPGDVATKGAAEAYQWSPNRGSVAGVRIASSRTEAGYRVEAAIPWQALGVKKVEEGMVMGVDVVLSDSDQTQPQQDTLFSLSEQEWRLRGPDRLVEMALAPSTGKVDPSTIQSTFTQVGDEMVVEPGQSVQRTITPEQAKNVRELVIRARMDTPKVAGGTHIMSVAVNGQELDMDRVRNRLPHFDLGIREISTRSRSSWFLLYAPSFDLPDPFSTYAVEGINPYEFRFDVSDIWKADQPNTVTIEHTRGDRIPKKIVAYIGISQTLTPKLSPPPLKPAPTGELAVYEPLGPQKPEYKMQITEGGAVKVQLGDRTWLVNSAYSTVTPGWARLTESASNAEWQNLSVNGSSVHAQTRNFTIERTATRHDDHVQVIDRLTNTTDEDLPILIRHHMAIGSDVKQVYIAGQPIENPKYYIDNGAVPTATVLYENNGIAVVAEDDILRAQGHMFVDGGDIGIDDRYFVLAADKTIELEFSIYPLQQADPFLLVNSIRRNWNTNFTIDGSFTFTAARKPLSTYNQQELASYLNAKSAHFASTTIPRYKPGIYAHGTAIRDATDREAMAGLISRIKEAVSGIEALVYFHCFISVGEGDKQNYKDAMLLRPDGTQADYRSDKYPLYVPWPGSSFAAVQDELIDYRFDVLGATGIYWDELAYSAYKYDYSGKWDGVSAIIDTKTHQIARRIANIPLATQPWRAKAVEHILKRGTLVGNSAPRTRTFTKFHFPRFLETGSITNLIQGQLYTPIALGDHLTERTPLDCYRQMVKGLDYGALYYWYFDQIVATEPTLTQHMFPATPIELGQGYLIAQERIITNTSGLFGWGDASNFDAYVYDRRGQLTDEYPVTQAERDGRSYAEVRIPEGYAVAIIRKQ